MALRCPTCKKEIVWEGNVSRPFCSDHCRNVDLGRWLHEEYAVRHDQDADAESGSRLPANDPRKS
ncbi:MAG: DNA gyrase inhibitor YacG [Nitrospirae bacterium]|nr:DNA gyrase inhibitor YacG [Nitrospirota bacterium]